MRFIYRLLRGVESRNTALLLLRPPKGLYQPYGTTSFDRYPETFQYVRDQLADRQPARILSFGCSTGEEVFSLRRYFPEATIVGLDINPFNIGICRIRCLRTRDERIHFAVANSTAGEADASFDAIFAMAVFRHGDLNTPSPPIRCDHRIRFAGFEQSMADLARVLKPSGLLVVQHAMFRFHDTRLASRFETLLTTKLDGNGPIYGRNDCLLADVGYDDVVFRKIE